jgi:large subunit ribosomal protein L15
MNIHEIKPKTQRQFKKRVGRGGKRGTYSGKGTKGQKSRAGAGVKPGFRGGDNRIWQLFPKNRGASKKPGGSGNDGPHPKHRFFRLHREKPIILGLNPINEAFDEGETITPQVLLEKGVIKFIPRKGVKILGDGSISKKMEFEGFMFSQSAREKIAKAGGKIK